MFLPAAFFQPPKILKTKHIQQYFKVQCEVVQRLDILIITNSLRRETHQHISIIHIKVKKQEEGDEESEEWKHGAFPETPHLVHRLPH